MKSTCIALLAVVACCTALAQKSSLPDTPSSTALKSDYAQEPYVVEQLKNSYRFENDGTGSRETVARVRVQNEAGVEQMGQLIIGYSSASERVELNYARVRKSDGTLVAAGPDSIQDLTTPVAQVAPVYTDYHQKHITIRGLRPGDTLEYSYTTVLQTALAAGQFWADYDFDKSSIVLDEQLEINIPKARTVKLKTKPKYAPKISDEGDRRVYRWTSAHLVRETEEDRKKRRKKENDEDRRPAVQMTTFKSWEEVGQWYESLEKDRRAVTPELKAKAEELTRDKKTDIEKLQALYDYVAKNFRYVSLSFGVGRYQPHSAAEVFANQYGDCKDKHTLLAGLSEAIGIHPWSVLINSSRKLDADVPSPSQFDHVITLAPVGDDMVWMDSTTEVAPFRMLSFNIRDKQALAIPPDGKGRLVTTPADLPFASDQSIDVNGKITDLGRLDATVDYNLRGDAELMLRMLFRRVPPARWGDLVKVLAQADGFSPEAASDLKADAIEDTSRPFHISYKLSQPNYLDWSTKKARLDLPLPHMRMTAPDDDDDSPEPVKIGPKTAIVERLKLQLPAKYTAEVPLPVASEKDFGAYQSSYKLDGNVLTAERSLKTNVSEIPPARLPEFQSFRRILASDEGQQVGLESATASTGKELQGMKTDDLHDAGVDALKSGNFKLAADLFEQVTRQEPKHKTAWNNLGRAYMGLGQFDKAIAALDRQIEINPYDDSAYTIKGRVLWQQRKYDEAAAAFRKQIEVNPLDKLAHVSLGSLLAEQRKFADAVPELEKDVNLVPDDAILITTLGRAYLNTGQTEKALKQFDHAVELAPAPPVWNDIAYELSLKKVSLDRAQRYAESAVSATTAALRNVSLEKVSLQDLGLVSSIQSYWDTLGWVYFQQGDTQKAVKYVQAAWLLGQHGEVGDHLGQIYEKLGDKEKAAAMYQLAMAAPNKVDETRGHLASLVGEARVEGMVKNASEKLADVRTLDIPATPPNVRGSADFLVLLSAGPKVEDAKFVSGDDSLKGMTAVLKAAKYDAVFPAESEAKLIRRGTLSCGPAPGTVITEAKKPIKKAAEKTSAPAMSVCKLVLVNPDEVRSAE